MTRSAPRLLSGAEDEKCDPGVAPAHAGLTAARCFGLIELYGAHVVAVIRRRVPRRPRSAGSPTPRLTRRRMICQPDR